MTEATQSLLPVTPELLPCPNPWCESHKYGQEGAPTRDDVMWLSGTESRIVGCAYCNLQGPIGKGEDEAIALWNTRSQSHSLPGDVGMREALAKRTSMSTVAGGGKRPHVEIRFANLADAHALTDAVLGRTLAGNDKIETSMTVQEAWAANKKLVNSPTAVEDGDGLLYEPECSDTEKEQEAYRLGYDHAMSGFPALVGPRIAAALTPSPCPGDVGTGDLLAAVIQYRDDLRRPPSADSVQRRLDWIEAIIAKNTGVQQEWEGELTGEEQAMIDRAWDRHVAAGPQCEIPPKGWVCTRGAGHDGPCAAALTPSALSEKVVKPGFQSEVGDWMLECFGSVIAADLLERADRFTEEALELAQTMPGFTADRAHALVDYVFSRPIGERRQEVGGVMVTLAALCNPVTINIADEAERELARVWTKVEAIRAKQAGKPTGSALPVAVPSALSGDAGEPAAWLYERGEPFPVRYIHDVRMPAYLSDADGWTETPLYAAHQGAGDANV